MHFHLPKPLHGWRAFAGEVGIIVLGVLIALSAEQVVESVHQRNEVRELRDALRAELADDRGRWERIRASDNCTEHRLDALEHWLAVAPPGARVTDAFPLFMWNVHSSTWEMARASPAAQLLRVDERLTYSSLYDALENWRQIDNDELKNAEDLDTLFANANQPEVRRQLPLLLTRARTKLKARQQDYPYLFTRFDALNIAGDQSKLTLSVDPDALCAPLESVG